MNLVLLLCLVTCACATSRGQQTYSLEDAEVLFEKYIVDYNKQYADEHEKQMRFEMFKQSLVEINALNEGQEGVEVFGINKMSDYTAEEIEKLKGLKPHYGSDTLCDIVKTDADIPDAGAPDSWDWRDHNAVTTVKDQGKCGSCYAFCAIGSLEGQYAIKHKELVSLSVQQVIDCATNKIVNIDGCLGGLPAPVFMYIMAQGGIDTEYDYPYRYKTVMNCTYLADKSKVKVTDCVSYNLESQDKLKQALYANGPIAVGIDSFPLIKYKKGVIKNCVYKNLNHGVLLVGYGTDPVQGDYWLFKNSYGSDFGEDGYFRLERAEGKISCGMLNEMNSSPIIA